MKQLGKWILFISIGAVAIPLHSELLDSEEGFSSLNETSKQYSRDHGKRIGYCMDEGRAGKPINSVQ